MLKSQNLDDQCDKLKLGVSKYYMTIECRALLFAELSEASKMTLVHQGGKMTEEEAKTFENHPQFKALIRMRGWDEKAKVQGLTLKPLEEYKEIFKHFLETDSNI